MFRETSPLPALIPLSAYQSETHDDGDDDDDNDGDDDDGNHNNDDDVGYQSDIHHGCGKSVFVYF